MTGVAGEWLFERGADRGAGLLRKLLLGPERVRFLLRAFDIAIDTVACRQPAASAEGVRLALREHLGEHVLVEEPGLSAEAWIAGSIDRLLAPLRADPSWASDTAVELPELRAQLVEALLAAIEQLARLRDPAILASQTRGELAATAPSTAGRPAIDYGPVLASFARRHAEVVGRRAELETIAGWIEEGVSRIEIRGEPFVGKTALATALCVRELPDRATVVAYFVVESVADSWREFLSAVISQLLAHLDSAEGVAEADDARKHQFDRLWAEAARRATADRPLVLVVDGLDEQAGSDDVAIASLLPYRLDANATVIVTQRAGGDPDLVRRVDADEQLELVGSAESRVRRAEAAATIRRELRDDVGGGCVAALAVAGGLLSSSDIAEILDRPQAEIRTVLDRFRRSLRHVGIPGLPVRVTLGHVEFGRVALTEIGPVATERMVDAIAGWAERWKDRGWPEATPHYLVDDLAACLLRWGRPQLLAGLIDDARVRRLSDATGADLAVIEEIDRTLSALSAASSPGVDDLAQGFRLAAVTHELREERRPVGAALEALARTGHGARAKAIAMASSQPASALTFVIRGLVSVDDDEAFALASSLLRDHRGGHGLGDVVTALWRRDRRRTEALLLGYQPDDWSDDPIIGMLMGDDPLADADGLPGLLAQIPEPRRSRLSMRAVRSGAARGWAQVPALIALVTVDRLSAAERAEWASDERFRSEHEARPAPSPLDADRAPDGDPPSVAEPVHIDETVYAPGSPSGRLRFLLWLARHDTTAPDAGRATVDAALRAADEADALTRSVAGSAPDGDIPIELYRLMARFDVDRARQGLVTAFTRTRDEGPHYSRRRLLESIVNALISVDSNVVPPLIRDLASVPERTWLALVAAKALLEGDAIRGELVAIARASTDDLVATGQVAELAGGRWSFLLDPVIDAWADTDVNQAIRLGAIAVGPLLEALEHVGDGRVRDAMTASLALEYIDLLEVVESLALPDRCGPAVTRARAIMTSYLSPFEKRRESNRQWLDERTSELDVAIADRDVARLVTIGAAWPAGFEERVPAIAELGAGAVRRLVISGLRANGVRGMETLLDMVVAVGDGVAVEALRTRWAGAA